MGAPAEWTDAQADDHVLRARRTAAVTRVVVGAAGVILLIGDPALLPTAAFGVVGFAVIQLTSIVQLAAPRLAWLSIEESLSGTAAVFIVGLGNQRVSVLSMLWLTAVASGVLARGGRLHWFGRALVIGALLLPVARYGSLGGEYAAFFVATLGLLLTSGRLTRELNELLQAAQLQADSAERLLLAGDIASRMAERDGREPGEHSQFARPAEAVLGEAEVAGARLALQRLIRGEGLSMVVQPIVDLGTGAVHGYEALARFAAEGIEGGPLHWFALADELGERPALERACLSKALALFAERPAGRKLSLNLSAPVLLDPETQEMLHHAGDCHARGLHDLIVEITEETLVHGDMELLNAFAPLRRRGACLAVDDMGAGYSGLRQITSVLPRYLKLDRSLVSGIDGDEERAALVGALAGYSRQVDCLLIAEGVETEAELNTVRALGAPLVQGFYLSRPAMPWPRAGAYPLGSADPVAGATSEIEARQLALPAADRTAVTAL